MPELQYNCRVFAGVDAGGFFEGKDCFLTFSYLLMRISRVFLMRKAGVSDEEIFLSIGCKSHFEQI
jgi:hypothetical protein